MTEIITENETTVNAEASSKIWNTTIITISTDKNVHLQFKLRKPITVCPHI